MIHSLLTVSNSLSSVFIDFLVYFLQFCMCQPGAKAGKVKKSRSSRRTVENAEEEADRSG